MTELQDYVGLLAVPLVIAMVEAVKRVWVELPERWYPAVGLICSAIIEVPVGWQLGFAPVVIGLLTLVVALAASGLYSGGRALAGH